MEGRTDEDGWTDEDDTFCSVIWSHRWFFTNEILFPISIQQYEDWCWLISYNYLLHDDGMGSMIPEEGV